jgi:hypothetical protein
MSLSGTYIDRFLDVFHAQLLHQAQQKGSRLNVIAMKEMMSGKSNYFDKIGSVGHYVKSTRGQPKNFTDITFERRLVTSEYVSFDHIIDKDDLIKYVDNPANSVVMGATFAMGRHLDAILMSAIADSATIQVGGSTTTASISLSVAVNDHSYDSGSGDVGLTAGKLKAALAKLHASYGYDGTQRLYCIAPSAQLMELATDNQVLSSDFRLKRPLETPGVFPGLAGFMGIDFIAYEDTGLESTHNRVYLLTEDAMKLGIFQDMKVEILKNPALTGNPDVISVTQAVGAVRMYEEKVVKILCAV